MIKYDYIITFKDNEIHCKSVKDVVKSVNNMVGFDVVTLDSVYNKLYNRVKNNKRSRSNFYEIKKIRLPPKGPYIKKKDRI